MNRRKTCLFIALVLALSLALSPVSAYADELDTPVHEDPIDELQESSGWVNGHFVVYNIFGVSAEFDVSVYCEYQWTEGISGWIKRAAYDVTNAKVNGTSCNMAVYLNTEYSSYNTWGKAEKVFQFTHPYLPYSSVYVAIDVFCDDYGDLSINARRY